MQPHSQPASIIEAATPVCTSKLPGNASAGTSGSPACTAHAAPERNDEHMQCDPNSPHKTGAAKTASYAGSDGRCSPDAMQTDSPVRSPKSEPMQVAFAQDPAQQEPAHCSTTVTAVRAAKPQTASNASNHEQQQHSTGVPATLRSTTPSAGTAALKGQGQDQPQPGMVQAIGWPAMDLMTSMFGIQPHAVRMSDVPALTAQAQAQLQRASELLGASDPAAAHSCLASAAATAAVAAAAVAMSGSTPPQAAHMQQLLTYMQHQQQHQLVRGGLSAAFMPGPNSSTQGRWHPAGSTHLPPVGPTGVFTATMGSQLGNSNQSHNNPGSTGGLFQPPQLTSMGPGGPPFGFSMPSMGHHPPTSTHGLYPAGYQRLMPLQLLQQVSSGSVPWAIPTPSAQAAQAGPQPHHASQGSWQEGGGDQPARTGAAIQAAQPHTVIGSAPSSACWPTQLPSQVSSGTVKEPLAACGSGGVGVPAATGLIPPLRRRASHAGNGTDDLDGSGDSPSKQIAAVNGQALSLWSHDADGSTQHHKRQVMGHGLPTPAGLQQQPTTGALARGSSRSYRFVVQAANSTWRAQVGHNEGGTAKKYYGMYRRTAEQAARDADKLLYKTRGAAFPLNLGISQGERLRLDRLSLNQLLDELHDNSKDAIREETSLDGTALQSAGVGLLGTTAPSPPPPCASPLYATSAMDAASALMFMSQDALVGSQGQEGQEEREAASPAIAPAAGGASALPEPGNGREEPTDMACSDEDQQLNGCAVLEPQPASDPAEQQHQLLQDAHMHVGVVPKQLRRKRSNHQAPVSGVGHSSPALLVSPRLPIKQQAGMEYDHTSPAAITAANITCRDHAGPMYFDLPATAATAAVLEPSDPSRDMQHMLLVDSRGWLTVDGHMQGAGSHGEAVEQDAGFHSLHATSPHHSSRTRHGVGGRLLGHTGGKGTIGNRASPTSPAAESSGQPNKASASPYGLRSTATATHDMQQGGGSGSMDDPCQQAVQQVEGMNSSRPVSAGKAGRQAGGEKPAAEKPPYRYIVKIGSRWRAQVGQVDAGVQRKFYGPYLDDPALAARDADQILYKLRGPGAATNFPLPPEVKARLDCMTLSQLLQSFKGNNSNGAANPPAVGGGTAEGTPAGRGNGQGFGGASRASSNGTSSSSAAAQLQQQGSADTNKGVQCTVTATMGPAAGGAHAAAVVSTPNVTPDTTTGSPAASSPASHPDECTASGSDAAGGSVPPMHDPYCCVGEEAMHCSQPLTCEELLNGDGPKAQRQGESSQQHAAGSTGTGRRSSGSRKHSGGWGGYPPAASAIFAALAPAVGGSGSDTTSGGFRASGVIAPSVNVAHTQSAMQGLPSAGAQQSMAPPPAIPLSSVLPAQMLRLSTAGPTVPQGIPSASVTVSSSQQAPACQPHQPKLV